MYIADQPELNLNQEAADAAEDQINPTPLIIETHFDVLRKAIIERFRHHLQDIADCPQDYPETFGNELAQWCEDAMLKFADGQREHGGDLRDRDVEADARQEDIDRFWYTVAARLKPPVIRFPVHS